MRRIVKVFYFIKIYVINYSYLVFTKFIFVLIVYVKMFISWRQYAWVYNKQYYSHQRLKKEYLDSENKILFISKCTLTRRYLNRLIVTHAKANKRNIPKIFYTTKAVHGAEATVKNKIYFDFEKWLVGVTDGDGTFSIARQNNKWSLAFKITQSRYNLRLLYYIKKQLGVGSITKDNTKAQFFIRDRKKLNQIIFPIFDKYPLLTSKMFNYDRFKQAYYILENHNLTKDEKDKKLFILKDKIIPQNYIAPVWSKACLPLNSVNDINNVITKPWLVGFIEAEGSFYLVSKDSTRIVHGFGLTQKLDSIVLEAIGLTLHIPIKVKFKSNYNHYILDTTNSRAIENIINYFKNTMKGIKSAEYRVWARSYVKYKGNFSKLSDIRNFIRKLRTKLLKIN